MRGDPQGLASAPSARPSVSLIVPVYNVERYLGECLDSACGQTLDDIEVVCVNDGSTDGSLELLRQASAHDGRIRIIDKPNGGLSSARNRGMDAARGEIVMFLDSDDRLHSEACERVLGRFRETGADVVTFGAECFPSDAPARLAECLSPRDVVYCPFSEDLLFKERSRPYVWRSAFRRRFLEECSLRFREDLSFGEDQVFYFEAYPRASSVALMSDKLYAYRLARQGSLMDDASSDDAGRVAKHVAIAERILSTWAENGWFARFGWRTLGWTMEFVAMDLAALPHDERIPLARRFGSALGKALPRTREGSIDEDVLSFGPATRRVLRWFVDPDGEMPGKTTLYRFYVERRGLAACVERALGSLKRG